MNNAFKVSKLLNNLIKKKHFTQVFNFLNLKRSHSFKINAITWSLLLFCMMILKFV
jgi:hypothetical protein